ncbi:MAG: T9SS type A sorting domain-containing protein [Bacteroidia bacterium]|nr:T9SS type A sorting domain-containing protein [Bacteroidia bacterium]
MKRFIKILSLLYLITLCFNGWGQILTFEFSALAGGEATAASNTNDANLSPSTISRGAGLTASANGGRFNATNWAITSIANAVSGNNYMEFTITPNSGYQFSVSSIYFQFQRSATGNYGFALRSSLDGYATDIDAIKTIADVTTTVNFTFTFAQANSTSAVTYRLYSYAEATTGSGGIGDGTGNDIVINGTVTATAVKPQPTNQPTAFAVGTVTTSAIPLTWTAAVAGTQAPDGYLIKLNTGAVVDPIDATDPADITAVTGGVANKKVTPGSASSATSFTSMVAGTMYNYKIYSYTNSGANINFLLTSPPALNHATLPNAVTAGSFTATGPTTANITWTAASGYSAPNHSTMVFVKATSAVNAGVPTNAPSTYTANTTFSAGTAYQGDASAYCVYNGDGTNVSITGLNASTTYHILIYVVVDASNSNSTNSYSSSVVANGITSCTNVALPYSQGFNTTSIPACWSTQTVVGASAIQYVASSSNPTTTPQEGADYVYWNSYSFTSGNETRLISPAIVTTGASLVDVKFYWLNENNASYSTGAYLNEGVLVQYSTDGSTWDAGTFYARHDGALTAGTSQWNLKTLTLPAGAGNQPTIYVSFKFHSSFGDNCSLDNVVIEANVVKPEPTNYPTAFSCGTTTSATIPLSWTAATAGTQAPDYYLIKWSSTSYAAISNPVDGTAIADDIITVGSGSKNIAYGTNSYTVPNLNQNTTYYFKIWTYTNAGTNINYKTTATEPQTNCTTLAGPCVDESWATNALPAGWIQTSVTFTSNYAEFAAMNGELATLAVTNPTTLTFDLTRTTNTTSKTMYIEVSTTTQGGTYNTIATYTHTNTTSGGTTNCTVDLSAYNSSTVYIKFRKASSTTSPWRLDNVTVTCGACTEPTTNPTTLTFSNITNTTIDFTIGTVGNGNKRILFAKEASAVDYTPIDGTTYTANDFYASTDYSGNRAVYIGTGSTGTITGLTPGTVYYFKVFEFSCATGSENYYSGGTILAGMSSTYISPVTGLNVSCQTSNTATISWIAPEGTYDGVVIGMRNSTLDCHSIGSSDNENTYTSNTNFGSGYQYGLTTPYSFVVYKGTGTSVTVTGLTTGQSYKIMAYTYKNSTTWSASTPTTSITSLGIPNVSSLSSSPLDAEVQVSWANPLSACFDEVIVIAKQTTAVTASPSGDGTAYTANTVFSSGTAFDGGFFVYKGTSNSVNITGLTNGTEYCFKVFIRSGTSWSTGVSTCQTPIAGGSVFVPGSIAVVGVCSNVDACLSPPNYSAGDDEISIVCFNDLTTGSMIDMTDNGWERCTTGKWGNTEGYLRIRRTGANIPKGTIITFRLKNNSPYFEGIYPDDGWVIDIRYGSLILNTSGDQIYFMTGGTWNNGTTNGNNATYTGGVVLFGFNTNDDWVPGVCSSTTYPSGSTGTGASQNSGLYHDLECFNMMPGVATDFIKFNIDLSTAAAMSQRTWIELIKDPDNWEGFIDCDDYYNTAINDFTASDTSISILATGGIGVIPGLWTGAGGSNDWFTCSNWDNMIVPDSTVNVLLPNTGVTNNCRIGDPTGTHFTKASCNNITNNLSGFNFLIGSDDSNAGTDETISKLDVFGNFTNNSTFTHSNGTVSFKGNSEQTISGTIAPIFYNLTVLNTAASGGITLSTDVSSSNVLTLTDGIITTGTNKFIVSNNNSTTGISGGTSASFINGNLRRAISTNTNTYFFPVGNGNTAANYKRFDFINNNLASLNNLDVNVSSLTESGNNIDSRLAITQNATPMVNLASSSIWTVNPNVPTSWAYTSGSYGVKLYVANNAELSAADDNKFCAVKRADASTDYAEWSNFEGSTTIPGTGAAGRIYNSGNGYAQRTGYIAFSKHAIVKGLSPLPIELISFNAKLHDKTVILDWSTASENNNDFFSIERANNINDFEEIGKINGAGNSSSIQNYTFIDNNPIKGLSYYRLKQIDYNGDYTFSDIKNILINEAPHLAIINLFTNEYGTTVIFNNPTKDILYLKITDMSGKIIYSQKINTENDNIMLELNKSQISSGIYSLNLYNNSESVSQKLIIY